ncbi:MAG: sel1 repeat family protein [bacterium]|nr:MAG: sel1 repeat family protein [bacterium]
MEEHAEKLAALRRAAEEGDAEAQAALGTMLAAGEGIEQDFEEALTWLRRAAQQGEPTAMFNLGFMHERGVGTEPDADEAALWFWQAAEKGDTGSKMKLGTMLIKGQGFSPEKPAVKAIKASAERGHAYAQSFYGKLHLDGVGVEQSDANAEKWFRMAAAQGEESAVFNISEMMFDGRITDTSQDELAQWLFNLGRSSLEADNLVKAFDCLVSIRRFDPDNFLAQRLESEIERANQSRMKGE